MGSIDNVVEYCGLTADRRLLSLINGVNCNNRLSNYVRGETVQSLLLRDFVAFHGNRFRGDELRELAFLVIVNEVVLEFLTVSDWIVTERTFEWWFRRHTVVTLLERIRLLLAISTTMLLTSQFRGTCYRTASFGETKIVSCEDHRPTNQQPIGHTTGLVSVAFPDSRLQKACYGLTLGTLVLGMRWGRNGVLAMIGLLATTDSPHPPPSQLAIASTNISILSPVRFRR
ncbi:hypothetical protein [Halostagnicola sp. A-GB9-2]|uniref:hypothetical protein n=1 Tax=Halostagnicola sp. A-GB9-2 TaxID=3048066 RepID=UPI0024BFA453|nr:hypothetical protein [Halostagnicola sp. A-GB9-2]MDJ1433538.1 hypothetical protein [Halostagnicola sp. A-GB9-2]